MNFTSKICLFLLALFLFLNDFGVNGNGENSPEKTPNGPKNLHQKAKEIVAKGMKELRHLTEKIGHKKFIGKEKGINPKLGKSGGNDANASSSHSKTTNVVEPKKDVKINNRATWVDAHEARVKAEMAALLEEKAKEDADTNKAKKVFEGKSSNASASSSQIKKSHSHGSESSNHISEGANAFSHQKELKQYFSSGMAAIRAELKKISDLDKNDADSVHSPNGNSPPSAYSTAHLLGIHSNLEEENSGEASYAYHSLHSIPSFKNSSDTSSYPSDSEEEEEMFILKPLKYSNAWVHNAKMFSVSEDGLTVTKNGEIQERIYADKPFFLFGDDKKYQYFEAKLKNIGSEIEYSIDVGLSDKQSTTILYNNSGQIYIGGTGGVDNSIPGFSQNHIVGCGIVEYNGMAYIYFTKYSADEGEKNAELIDKLVAIPMSENLKKKEMFPTMFIFGDQIQMETNFNVQKTMAKPQDPKFQVQLHSMINQGKVIKVKNDRK